MGFTKSILAASALLSSAWAFDVEGMLAAPRRSTGQPNPSGEISLFSSTTYNWTTHKSSTAWYILDIASGNVTEAPFDSSVSEIAWVGDSDTSILYINGTNDEVVGGVTLYTADLSSETFSPTLVASLDAPYAGLKATKTESGDINFVVYCLAYDNGTAYNPDAIEEPLSTGGLYDSIFVRHWDFYITQQRNAVFGGVLSAGYGNGTLSLKGEVKNLLSGINATVTRPESPIPPFGDQGDYDLSPDGKTVTFISKSPDLPKANFTASYVYVVPHDGSEVAVAINGPGTTAPETAQGASFFPRFSPDSTKIAFGQQDGISYESDRTKLYVATVDGQNAEVTAVAEDWDSVVGGVSWGPEGKLYVAAEVHAMNRLFVIPYDAEASFKPENFTNQYSYVQDWFVYPDGTALITAAASWSSRIWYTQKPGEEPTPVFSANEVDPELAGLKPDSVTNFWFTNADGDEIHTLVFLPTDFDESKKYPLCFVVHGGPQVAQGDTWSTRWNLRLWADVNNCVVTTTQFTGTPGYGQAFTDKITNNWGGTPYTDLEEAFEYIKENISYIDTDNAIAAGASYGAFMMNWFQGHALGKKFKAIVSHDGKLSQMGAYQTEELWFIQHDQNGTVWENPENYAIWDPQTYIANATTPHFIVHNDLDYRVVQSDGIALFNILQSIGVPSRFLHFPDEGHWVLNRENSKVWHNSIFNWIQYWTGQTGELIQDIVIKS